MQLVKKEVKYVISDEVKKGDVLELENTLSCDKQVVKIIELDNDGMKVIKLQNGQTETYTYEGLTNYEARKMKIVYDTDKSILSQAAQAEANRDKTGIKYSVIADYYLQDLQNRIKQVYGLDVDVRSAMR